MKGFIVVLSAAVLAIGCTHGGRTATSTSISGVTAQDENALAGALGDRTAGPAQECISEPDLAGNRFFGRGLILFRSGTNDVLYVNRPPEGCPGLNAGRAIKTRSTSTRLCRGDSVTVFDPASGIEFGNCTLGEFTPYR
jgi:hypothetical protein